MMSRLLRIYLDSNDYSVLSDPRKETPQLKAIRGRLLELAESGRAEFWYSAVHLSEMAPLGREHASLANARTELLVSLCRRNALVSFDRLIQAELEALGRSGGPTREVYSRTGDWFPVLSDLISPTDWRVTIGEIMRALKERGLSREQRRAIRREWFGGGRPNQDMKDLLARIVDDSFLDEVLRIYPMRPQDANTLVNYITGTVTREEAEQAFLESLRDPRWMMQWFDLHADRMTPFTQWLRAPAKRAKERMSAEIAVIREAHGAIEKLTRRLASLGVRRSGLRRIDGAWWKERADEAVVAIVGSLAAELHPSVVKNCSLDNIERGAPGLSAAIRVAIRSAAASVGPTPRSIKESDFLDAVHSMYGPYVDIFRADDYMAPVVGKVLIRHQTVVVPKLTGLLGAIDACLADPRRT